MASRETGDRQKKKLEKCIFIPIFSYNKPVLIRITKCVLL